MPARRVAVAASGGRDSTALLHATVRAGRQAGIEVMALHVHHGLHADADAWQSHVSAQARRWGAGFDTRRLAGRPGPGDSVEAWARRGRYQALADMARAAGCDLVLLAQHRRDQAETFLLQALRGGGPRGLAAMPARVQREGIVWARPWLDQPREAIEAYVRRHRLSHIHDGSNDDPRFARNALRLSVWPDLLGAFPQAEASLVDAAGHAQHAAALAAEVAAADLAGITEGGALRVEAWQALTPARQRNALATWLHQLSSPLPGSLLERLMQELPGRRLGRWPAGQGELALYRGLLQPAAARAPLRPTHAVHGLNIARAGNHPVPGFDGHLVVTRCTQGGVPAAALRDLRALPRQGGEQFRLAAGAVARSLKKQYQARGVPAWERDGPLLFTAGGQLLFVPGLGIDAAQQAAPGTPQLTLRWVPGPRQPAK